MARTEEESIPEVEAGSKIQIVTENQLFNYKLDNISASIEKILEIVTK